MASWWNRYGGQTFYRILMLLIVSAVVYSGCNFVMYMVRVDGNYSQWTVYTPCSATCGTGVQTRTRTCTEPEPEYGGKNCSELGPEEETRDCNTNPCPINGGYGEWTEYGPCSLSCGGGMQVRTRECNNPSPMHGGKTCQQLELGPKDEERPCNEQPCPVDGGYSEWEEWDECSVSCGGGIRRRTRECTNPFPAYGGKSCDANLGPPFEEEECNIAECPTPTPTPVSTQTPAKQTNTPPSQDKGAEEARDNEKAEEGNEENEEGKKEKENEENKEEKETEEEKEINEEKETEEEKKAEEEKETNEQKGTEEEKDTQSNHPEKKESENKKETGDEKKQ